MGRAELLKAAFRSRSASSGSKKRVAVDLDNVLAGTNAEVVEDWNTITGRHFTIEDVDQWNWEKTKLKMPYSEFVTLCNRLWTKESYRIKPLITEDELKPLATRFNTEVVTTREREHSSCVSEWMAQNFPSLDLKLRIFSSHASKLHSGYDYLVDDGVPVADEVVRLGESSKVKLALVEWPWNRNMGYEFSPNITAVPDTKTAIQLLLAKEPASRKVAAL